jgi:hypothetical protein
MRSSAVRLGEFLIFIGVFVLALQYIDWGAFAPIERADLVITGGVVLLICFVLALWSRSPLLDELIHVIALVVGAAVLGLIVSKSEVSTFVNVIRPGARRKTLSFDGNFDPSAATLTITLDVHNGDATVQTWDEGIFSDRAEGASARVEFWGSANGSSRASLFNRNCRRQGSAFAPHDSHWGRSARWRRTSSSGCRAGASMN